MFRVQIRPALSHNAFLDITGALNLVKVAYTYLGGQNVTLGYIRRGWRLVKISQLHAHSPACHNECPAELMPSNAVLS